MGKKWVFVLAFAAVLFLGMIGLARIYRSNWERERFDEIAARDVTSLAGGVPEELRAYIPPAARDILGAFDHDLQELRVSFSFSAHADDEFVAAVYAPLEIDPADLGGPVRFSWWPRVLQVRPSRAELEKAGMAVFTSRERVDFGRGDGVVLLVQADNGGGYLYALYR